MDTNSFVWRHIGPRPSDIASMLEALGLDSLEALVDKIVPDDIRLERAIELPPAMSEWEFAHHIRAIADKNRVFRSFIGQGYYRTIMPAVIRRNVLENPAWYTPYTPYQAEIAQGRLEALLLFQTVVSELTGLPLANASLLDEGTAVAEAVLMCHRLAAKKYKQQPRNRVLIDEGLFDQSFEVVKTRCRALQIEWQYSNITEDHLDERCFAVVLQYPDKHGSVRNYEALVRAAQARGIYVVVAADLLALTLLKPPGAWGADVVVGSSQRFGIPMMYGGPHAAYFATKMEYKRQVPGRIIGVSVDKHGNPAYRMALQTREQHIRREKATSNICTAQALLATLAAMYAVYHGPEGLKDIARRIHAMTVALYKMLVARGMKVINPTYFDTLTVELSDIESVRRRSVERQVNFFYRDGKVVLSLDECTTVQDLRDIVWCLTGEEAVVNVVDKAIEIPSELRREGDFLHQEVFHRYHSETEMMRFIKQLESKDLSLVHAMIPLGSCTMKLNAASELIPISWEEFAEMHPFAPLEQAEGYLELIAALEEYLCRLTGLDACSLQPNSGAQGEYAGLLAIKRYHHSKGEGQRNVVLIPRSAHGTNPASAVMAGLEVVFVDCDERGNIVVADLEAKAKEHRDRLAALMVTYPSTYGVYESAIRRICAIVHEYGGLVYMDGANMNAQLGITTPAKIGADVCHLNLHKTFAIPHGGGGPGVGPICVNKKLKPFLPGHIYAPREDMSSDWAVSSAPFGSAGILPISYAFIRLMGADGLKLAAQVAMLNANYMKKRLEEAFPVLFVGENDMVAHEFIIDFRPYKDIVHVEDVAKRLMDYSFHAPTISFPVANTFMIEPTESESKAEIDRFCDAMLYIKEEILKIVRGEYDARDNPIHQAPHTLHEIASDEWPHRYSRREAAYPMEELKHRKFWPSVGRIDNAYGDRHLQPSCGLQELCV